MDEKPNTHNQINTIEESESITAASLNQEIVKHKHENSKSNTILLQNIGLFFVVLLICLILGEGGLRIYDLFSDSYVSTDSLYNSALQDRYDEIIRFNGSYTKEMSFVFDPNRGTVPRSNATLNEIKINKYNNTHDVKYMLYASNFNSGGMRTNREVELENDPSVLRIAVLGNSFTYGSESFQNLIWPEQLNSMDPELEVLNFAMSNAKITDMYLTFKNETLPYNPDVVVLNLLVHDMAETEDRPFNPHLDIVNGKLEVSNVPLPNNEEFFNSYSPPIIISYLINFVKYRFDVWEQRGSNQYEHGYNILNLSLDIMKEDMQNKTFIVGILGPKDFNPEDKSTHKNHPSMYEGYNRIIELLNEKNINYFDGISYFHEQAIQHNINIESLYKEGHFNGLGNAIYAQGIHQTILSERDSDAKFEPYLFKYDDVSAAMDYYDSEGEYVLSIKIYDILNYVPIEENEDGYYSKRILTDNGIVEETILS